MFVLLAGPLLHLVAAERLGDAPNVPIARAAPSALDAPVDRRLIAVEFAPDWERWRHEIAAVAGELELMRHLELWDGRGLELFELAAPLQSDADVAPLLQTLAATPGIAYASPVLRGAHQALGVPTPRLVLRVGEVARASALEWLRDALPEARHIEGNFAGMNGAYSVDVDVATGFEVLHIARRLATLAPIEWVEPVLCFEGGSNLAPDDPLLPLQWSFANTGQDLGSGPGVVGFDTNLAEAHDLSTGSASVGIVVIDVGVQFDHPDLVVAAGTDLMTGTPTGDAGSPQNSFDSHGTAVAGVCSATRNNGLGVVGVAPLCTLYSARCFSSTNANGNWTTFTGNTALAIAFGEAMGARVSINSNYYGFTDASMDAKYAASRAAGMAHFVSAGNASSFGVEYPARLPTVFAIGATNEFSGAAGFTAIGPEVDFAAPGFHIWSVDRSGTAGYASGDYASVQGTSFAAPFVGGLAALCLALDSTLSVDDIGEVLQAACVDVVSEGAAAFEGADIVSGHGQPDALVCLRIAAGLDTRLVTSGGPVSAWQGGGQTLVIDAGPSAAGSPYLFLGSAAGTSPGFDLGGVPHIPLDYDAYFQLLVDNLGGPTIAGGLGVLDGNGRGQGTIAVPAVGPSFLGLTLYHAAVVFDTVPALAITRPATNARSISVSARSIHEYMGAPIALPDNDAVGVDVSFVVSGLGAALARVELVTDIEAARFGDVELELTSPLGTSVVVHFSNPFELSTNMKAVWGGNFSTSEDLANFNGENPSGTWTLRVADALAGNAAVVKGLALVLVSQ